jgi:hypothetical protein
MPEVTTQYYLGNDKIQYVALGDSPVATNPFTFTDVDPDAQAFITATGISGTEATAINTLVVALKAGGFWTGLQAAYPMVGGTSTSCKFNLKNPLDTDAAFRLSFAGTWTFDSSGAKPNGVSGTYADTFFAPATYQTTSNGSFSYYSFTNNAGSDDVEIGCIGTAASSEINIAVRFSDGNFYVFYGAAGLGFANSVSNGFYINNRAAQVEGWKNGTRVINGGTPTNMPSRNIYLAAENDGTGTYRNSSRGCSFASMGATLSDPAAFSTIVNNFQTTLGRNQY